MNINHGLENSPRKISLVAGILYLLTFISVPTLSLYGPVHDPNYILGSEPDTNILIGGILEIIVALAGIGTALVLYPILKRQNQILALGLVSIRTLEASTILLGVAFLLSIVTLHQANLGVDALVTGQALVALYDRIFLLGQSFMPVIVDLILGYIFFKSQLIPRTLSILALVGAPLLLSSDILVFFGVIGRFDSYVVIATIPVALFEISLGIWLIARGFNTNAPILVKMKSN